MVSMLDAYVLNRLRHILLLPTGTNLEFSAIDVNI